MEPESIGAIIGGSFVILNVGGFWFHEYRKHRAWRTNGTDLKEIKSQIRTVDEKVDCIDKAVGETKAVVNEQKAQCKQTVNRFDKTIADQGKEIIKLAGRKR